MEFLVGCIWRFSMLYGDEKAVAKLMATASNIAEQNNFKLVFAAVQGSISRGLARFDSDYDIRFLYVNKDSKCIEGHSGTYKEKDIVYRYYPEEDCFYDKIAFWEAKAFFSFLERPELNDAGLSVGLYNQVFWTLTSPYVWDPYGLVNKVLPIANKIINKKWLWNYFINYIEERKSKGQVVLRDYIYIVATIWQMQWLETMDSYPPLNMKTLEFICDNQKVIEIVNGYIRDMKKQAQMDASIKRKSHSGDLTERSGYLDAWIEESIAIQRNIVYRPVEESRVRRGTDYIDNILNQALIREKIQGVVE